MNIIKIGFVFMFLLLNKCNTKNVLQIEEKKSLEKKQTQYRQHYVKTLITDTKDTLYLEVFQDFKWNLFIFLKDKEGFLLGIDGSAHSDIEKGDSTNFIFKYMLDKDSISEYIIKTHFKDANWNEGDYSVIWGYHDGIKYIWQLTPLGLITPSIKDRNQDGIYEIVEYYNSKNKDGDVYRFDKGKLIPLQ